MEFLINIFNVILYQPLFNILIVFYQYLPGHDFGIAVIALTLFVRIILYPVMMHSIKSQKKIQDIQPKIQEIQEKYKDDKEKQAKAVMEVYKESKVNPFGGCLPLLLQLPILIALYRVFWNSFQIDPTLVYSFIPPPEALNPLFLGIIDLSRPNIIFAILAGIGQYFQAKTSFAKVPKRKKKGENQMSQFSGMMQKQMLYFFPAFTFFILLRLPAALGLYWMINILFSIFQQHSIYKSDKPKEEPNHGTIKS